MSAGRGAFLVVVAILLGVAMTSIIGDSGTADTEPAAPVPTTTATLVPSATTAAPAGGTTATTAAPTATTAKGTTSTTKAAKKSTTSTTKAASAAGARPADQVVVQVLNGSGVSGAASQRSNDLKAKGYQVLAAGNAPSQRTGNAVQCIAGYDKEAVALVQVLKDLAVTAVVEALPSPAPASFDAKANCYVILGK